MMLTGSSASPFAVVESAIYKTLFTGHSPYAALAVEVKRACIDHGATNGTTPAGAKEVGGNGAVEGQSGSLKAKEESEKKIN